MGLYTLISIGFLAAGTVSAQVSVTTQHNDNNRTGANLQETILKTSNVTAAQFGKLFSRWVDGQIYAQPLYLPGVSVAGATHNVVFVATEHNSVYAFDADDPLAAAPLWHVNLGPSVYYKEVSPEVNLHPEMGITGTPVIDAVSRTLYVVTYTSENTGHVYRLHALDVTTGQEKSPAAVIQGSVPGTGSASIAGSIAFDPSRQLQRPGLLLSQGVLYIAFGSHADITPYHGWVFAYNAANFQQLGIYNTSPGGGQAAIWQSGQGLTTDDQGSPYLMTGNGTSTMDGINVAEAFVKLQLNGSGLGMADWFMPTNADGLNNTDEDLGSGGVLHIPGSQTILGGGKQGVIYVLNTASLGHFGNPLQTLPVCFSGNLHGSPVYWNSAATGARVYFWCEEDHLQSYSLVNGTLALTRADQSATVAPPGMPGGFLSISSNGSTSGTGIIWATVPYNADAVHQTVGGVLRAYDIANLSNELWDSKQNDNRDDVGDFAKFDPALVVNGKVYIGTFSGQLVAYGLLSPTPVPPATYAINVGGPASGQYLTDTNFNGGTTVAAPITEFSYVDPKALIHPAPQMVYRTARQGNFTYSIPRLIPGSAYSVRLHFAEFQAAAGQRLFNVAINGKLVLTAFDINAAAGGLNRAIDKAFITPADNSGTIAIQFMNGSAGQAQCNGIEIAPIVSSTASYSTADTTTQGNWVGVYGADGYAIPSYATSYPGFAQVSITGNNLYVWAPSTADTRAPMAPLPTVGRIASTWCASANLAVDVNFTDGLTHALTLYLLDWDDGNMRAENIEIMDAATGTVLDTRSVSSFSAGQYLTWNVKGHVQVRIASTNDLNAVVSGIFIGLGGAVASAAQASFTGLDTSTQGTWKGVYGGAGYNVLGDSASFPAYAQVTMAGSSPFTWTGYTTDVRALQSASTANRIAGCLYSTTTFSVNLNLTDGLTHSVALYFLDWDLQNRTEKVEILDATSSAVLDTETVNSFSKGEYLTWNIRGSVRIRITNMNSLNAVLNGIFLDAGSTGTQAAFLGADSTTQGSWKGIYGSTGYNVINDSLNYPGYAKVTASGQLPFVWSGGTTDARALQKNSAGDRIAACFYSLTTFTVNLNLTDGQTHVVALYFLDWDALGRIQRIDIVDSSTNALLSTQTISSFSNGEYLKWRVRGNVSVKITSIAPPGSVSNAVLNGLFFSGN